MALEATLKSDRRYPRWQSASNYTAGEIVKVPDGRAGVIQGLATDNLASGDEVTADCEGMYEIAAASGTTFALEAVVDWDDSAGIALADGGAGDFELGKVARAKVSGETIVLVSLNI